jgi:hypothetical protein
MVTYQEIDGYGKRTAGFSVKNLLDRSCERTEWPSRSARLEQIPRLEQIRR